MFAFFLISWVESSTHLTAFQVQVYALSRGKLGTEVSPGSVVLICQFKFIYTVYSFHPQSTETVLPTG